MHKPGEWAPALGNVLGDWNNQLGQGESHTVRFVLLGPGVHSYETNTGGEELEVRESRKTATHGYHRTHGMVENFKRLKKTGKALNFEQLLRVLYGQESQLRVTYPHFLGRMFEHSKLTPLTE